MSSKRQLEGDPSVEEYRRINGLKFIRPPCEFEGCEHPFAQRPPCPLCYE